MSNYPNADSRVRIADSRRAVMNALLTWCTTGLEEPDLAVHFEDQGFTHEELRDALLDTKQLLEALDMFNV